MNRDYDLLTALIAQMQIIHTANIGLRPGPLVGMRLEKFSGLHGEAALPSGHETETGIRDLQGPDQTDRG